MVQYIFTPWRDRRELLAVRAQFYPEHQLSLSLSQQQQQDFSQQLQQQRRRGDDDYDDDGEQNGRKQEHKQKQKQQAVARVSMWMQRGGCPHMVESTALLAAAVLSDDNTAGGNGIGSGYAVRAAYSAAFSRFVTGLLDSHQDKQRKMSMYDVAKSVGLPATFVELRHQATHEQLPSLTRLRAAARKALDWIWDYYWRHLSEAETESLVASTHISARNEQPAVSREDGKCRELVMRYLEGEEEGDKSLVEEIRGCDEGLVLTTLDAISGSTRDSRVLRRAMALSREIMEGGRDPDPMEEDGKSDEVRIPNDIEMARAELNKAREEMKAMEEAEEAEARQGRQEEVEVEMSEEKASWTLYEEAAWIPKPIGVV